MQKENNMHVKLWRNKTSSILHDVLGPQKNTSANISHTHLPQGSWMSCWGLEVLLLCYSGLWWWGCRGCKAAGLADVPRYDSNWTSNPAPAALCPLCLARRAHVGSIPWGNTPVHFYMSTRVLRLPHYCPHPCRKAERKWKKVERWLLLCSIETVSTLCSVHLKAYWELIQCRYLRFIKRSQPYILG